MKKIGIIGAGASGLYAAINLKNENTDVYILEKNKTIGKKLLITGNSRCNITNAAYYEDFLERVISNKKFLYSSFNNHDNYATMDFFEKKGLDLVICEANRVFPKSQSSKDVVRFFERKIIEENIKLITDTEVIDIKKDHKFRVKTKNRNYDFDYLIIATGGLSYPNTGSSGDGYKFAKNFGHKITKTYPSLVPIFFKDKDLDEVKALSFDNVTINAISGGKKYSQSGPVLLTKNFISGPAALSLSSFLVDKKIDDLYLNLSEFCKTDLELKLIDLFAKNPNKDISNTLSTFFPITLINIILRRSGIGLSKKTNQITKEERNYLIENIKKFNIDFDRFGSFNTGVITKGGIDLNYINPKTMQSKIIDDLYFIGEVLDLDALSGGFNLQIAFTTAYAAAMAIKEKL